MPASTWAARRCFILGGTALAVSLVAGITRASLALFFQVYIRALLAYSWYLPL